MTNYINQNGDTHLILVIISGNEEEAVKVVKQGNSHPEVVNSYGDTALLLSIHYSMVKLSHALLETKNAKAKVIIETMPYIFCVSSILG